MKKVDARSIRTIEDAVDAFEPSVRYHEGLVQIGWAWHDDRGGVALILPRESVAHRKYPPRRLTPVYEPEQKPWTKLSEAAGCPACKTGAVHTIPGMIDIDAAGNITQERISVD